MSEKKINRGPAKGQQRLTPRRERFCQNIFSGMSQRAAYRDAFESQATDFIIDRYASELYRTKVVSDRIKELQNELAERNMVTVEKVLEELAHIAFDDIRNYLSFKTEKAVVKYDDDGEPIVDYVPVIEMKDSETIDTRSISEVNLDSRGNLKFKLYPKDSALAKIGQYLGMFVEKSEITGKDGGPIEINDARKLLIEKLVKKRNEE